MESDKLYRVQKEDLPKVEKMLNQCFAHDPLYETLIPDPEVRKNLMPELFKCDMDEFYATCEIFADSADLNSVLVVSDEAEPYNVFQFYFTEAMAALQTDSYLIKEDPSLKTFRNFMKGEDYLNSSWTDQLHQNQRLHIIYLAVDPTMQHHGIAAELLEEAIDYVCSCCPYIFSGSAEWNKSNPAFAGWRDSATKYCDRCMVRKMTDFYNALDEHEFSEGMPEYQAIVNY